MQRLLLSLTACVCFYILPSCSKGNDSTNLNNQDTASTNTWKVNDTLFTATVVNHSTNPIYSMAAHDGGPQATFFHLIAFQFNGSATPASGEYRITHALTGKPDEIFIEADIYDNGFPVNFIATGNTNKTVTVSAHGNNLTILLPEVWAKIVGAPDSVRISAQKIIE